MSRSKYTTPALAAATLLGGGLYFSRSKPTNDKTHTEDMIQRKREQADAKRDMGLGGAGVGMTNTTGGPELGAGMKLGNTSENPNRATQTPADSSVSREDLPSGGLEGGYGGGQTNARAIQIQPSSQKGTFSSVGDEVGKIKERGSSMLGGLMGEKKDDDGDGKKRSASQKLQAAFGTGGAGAGEKDRYGDHKPDPKDTRIKSHHADSPTNRGGSPFDKHRRDVTATTNTAERPSES